MTHNKVCTHSPHCCGGCDEWFGDTGQVEMLQSLLSCPYSFFGYYSHSNVRQNPCCVGCLLQYSNNTRVQMFYFHSNTTVPLQCVALVVRKAYVDRMSFGWLFLGISIKFLPGPYLTNSVLALDQWTFSDISSESRYNFYKDYFAVLKYY